MRTRWNVAAAATTLALFLPLTAQSTASAEPAPVAPGATAEPAAGVEADLRRLRADANAGVRVDRDEDGTVSFVRSTDGRAMLDGDAGASARRAATVQIARYGKAFGLDGTRSRAAVRQTFASATGGTIVRAEQSVDGVAVFGGQVVLSMDADGGVVSINAATAPSIEVPAPEVDEALAARVAASSVAKAHRVAPADLTVTPTGRRVYDPALVHVTDPLGVRPVWSFEVADGSDVRDTVLVGTDRGELALRLDDAPEVNRTVCDNAGAATRPSRDVVALCGAGAARVEGGPVSAVADVNQAYDHLGATSQTYQDLGAIDLTQLVGATLPSGQKSLAATVRWCFSDEPCPFDNAFWDGRQMVFGEGWAAADDVVAHELTHGYVDRTSGLFLLHQSGAINESMADVLGEIVDHRNPTSPQGDSAWTLGEDLAAGGALRSLADPTSTGQPDRMTSPLYLSADAYDDAGGVHHNLGVGNKTAYLISQGGTFNGRTVTGIDAGDPGLSRTGRLYLETIPRLTSGSQYADLGRVLASTCDELAAARAGGFVAADCASVRTAVAATELMEPPTDPAAAAPEAGISCPTGHDVAVLRRDDDQERTFGWTLGSLWHRTPDNGTPSWSREGPSSLFAWNPDPVLGEPSSSSAVSAEFVVPTGQVSFLHFHHAYALEFAPAAAGRPAVYYDGAQVLVQTSGGNGTWTTQSDLPWTNGPDKRLESSGIAGFGGDSRGYGSSQVELSSLGGQTVRIAFKVVGDPTGSLIGWWVDDVRLYACPPLPPTVPTGLTVRAGRFDAVVTWNPPARAAAGVRHYGLTVDGGTRRLSAVTRRYKIHGAPTTDRVVSLGAVDQLGQDGARGTFVLRPTLTRVAMTASGPAKRRAVSVTATVTARTSGARVRRMPVVLLRRQSGAQSWQTVARGTTSSTGTTRWRVRQSRPATYQVVAQGWSTWYGSAGPVRRVG